MSALVVAGSCNRDIVVTGGPVPRAGETVQASGIAAGAGGKGLNQAVAAARAGAGVEMIGAVGADGAGDELVEVLASANVDVGRLRRVDAPTGTAFVFVDDGENAISVVPGANGTIRELTDEERAAIRDAALVMLQLEIPLSAVADAATAAHDGGALVVLTPAPVVAVPDGIVRNVDVLVANGFEARQLSGAADVSEAAARLASVYPSVVVTLGEQGCLWRSRDGASGSTPAAKVRAVDSTGAGDTFAGYLAASMLQGRPLGEATRVATRAAGIAVTRPGAAASVPWAGEVGAS